MPASGPEALDRGGPLAARDRPTPLITATTSPNRQRVLPHRVLPYPLVLGVATAGRAALLEVEEWRERSPRSWPISSNASGEGHADPMEPEHRRWLRTLIAACDDAAAGIRGQDDSSSRLLLADIEELRARLKAELHGD